MSNRSISRRSFSGCSLSRSCVPATLSIISAFAPLTASAQYDLNTPITSPTGAAPSKPALLEFGFEKTPDGPLPGAWKTASPRQKPADGTQKSQLLPPRDPATWAIKTLENSKHIVCTPASPAADFNLLYLDQPVGPDLEVTLRFTPLSGSSDQGGGITFRMVDERNFYLLRYNPLKKDLRLYRVVDGAGEKIAFAENIDHIPGSTHTLTIRARGDSLTGWIDGTHSITATDTRYSKPGPVGLWTKSDAATAFRDLRISDRSQGGPELATSASNQIIITVEGMSCAICEGTVANTVKKLKGVKSVTASHEDNTCTVELEPGSNLTAEQVVKSLANTKYKASIRK